MNWWLEGHDIGRTRLRFAWLHRTRAIIEDDLNGEYRNWVRTSVERPTDEQARRFADWLSDDHSWYKHLPLKGPGEPFVLYLAPHVHQVQVDRDDGFGVWRDIVDNPDGTWLGDRLRIDLREGDQPPDFMGSVTQAAGGLSTR